MRWTVVPWYADEIAFHRTTRIVVQRARIGCVARPVP